MILFAKDWAKYPQASIHYETRNESFIRVADIYNKMGVSNCAFHLSLLDPRLKNVNARDESIDDETKALVVQESKNNFWYFIREVVGVPIPGSLESSVFIANRGNIALYWFFFCHVTTLTVIMRQTGKTVSLMVLVEWLLNLGATNTAINLLTKNESLKSETLNKLKELFGCLPEYINFKSKKDVFNTDGASISLLKNSFGAHLSSASPKQADKVGRGFTSPVNIVDEAAFIENIGIALGAMIMSGNAARETGSKNNTPYGTILTTTAGEIYDRDGGYIYNIASNSTMLDEHFYDAKDILDLTELIYKNSSASKSNIKKPIVYIYLSYRQLGYGEDWVQRRLSENISSVANIDRDIYNKWSTGSVNSPIPKEYLDTLKSNIVESPRSEFFAPYGFLVKWYISEQEFNAMTNRGMHVVIGIDTSEGVGRDDITLVMVSHTSGAVLATSVFNEVNLFTLADFFVSVLLRYENSTMIIERKSSAPSIIDHMVRKLPVSNVNPYTRLYNSIVQYRDSKYQAEHQEVMRARMFEENIFDKYKKHIGFSTSSSGATSRHELYSTVLMNSLKFTAHTTYDEKLISQLCSLMIKNARIDHPPGGNDDMVISKLLAHWLLINGRNLSDYGIDTTTILKSNKVYLEDKYKDADSTITEDEVYELEEEFNSYMNEYKQTTNEVLAMQLELRIRKIATEMNYLNKAVSVEEMLSNIKRQKKISYVHR